MLFKLTKNFFYLTISTIVSKLYLFIIVILISKHLGVVELGRFSLALSFVMIFSAFLDLGLFTLAVKDVSKNYNFSSKYINNILSIKILLSFFTFLVIALILKFTTWLSSDITIIYLFYFFIVIEAFSLTTKIVFRAFERFDFEMISEIVGKGLGLLLVYLVIFMKAQLSIIIFAMAIGCLLSFVLSLFIVRIRFINLGLSFDFKLWGNLIKASSPLVIAWFFMSCYTNIDKLILKIFTNDQTLGQYSAANVLSNTLQVIPFILSSVLLPVMSKYYNDKREASKRLYNIFIKYTLVISFFLTSIIFFYSNFITGVFFHFGQDSLTITNKCLQIIIWAQIPIFLYSLTNMMFLSADIQHFLVIVNGVGLLVALITNTLFIYYFGIIGACVSYLFTHLAIFITSMAISARYIFKINPVPIFLKFLFLMVIFLIALTFTKYWNPIISYFVAMSCFIIVSVFTKFIIRDDFSSLKHFFNSFK